MRQTKRKFVALSTALAMALVLVASLVPSLGVKAQEIKPSGGEYAQVTLMPDGTLHDGYTEGGIARLGAGSVDSFTVDATNKVVTFTNLIVSRMDVDQSNGWTYTFSGSNNEIKTELVAEQEGLVLKMDSDSKLSVQTVYPGVALADGTTATKDISQATYANPVKDVVFSGPASGGGESGGDDTSSVPVKDGYADQTVAPGSAVTIGFDTAITNFVNGTEQGLVYIDGTEVPSQYITATEGSTIITVAQEYLSQLPEGAHKMVVKFLDGTEGEASFTISSSAAASADGTTASSGTASSTATTTTTKATAAKTADALPYAGLALVFVGASAIGVIAIRRKNS